MVSKSNITIFLGKDNRINSWAKVKFLISFRIFIIAKNFLNFDLDKERNYFYICLPGNTAWTNSMVKTETFYRL